MELLKQIEIEFDYHLLVVMVDKTLSFIDKDSSGFLSE